MNRKYTKVGLLQNTHHWMGRLKSWACWEPQSFCLWNGNKYVATSFRHLLTWPLPKCQVHDSSRQLCSGSVVFIPPLWAPARRYWEPRYGLDHDCETHSSCYPSGGMASKIPCWVIMLENREAGSASSTGKISKSMMWNREKFTRKREGEEAFEARTKSRTALGPTLMLTSQFPFMFCFVLNKTVWNIQFV